MYKCVAYVWEEDGFWWHQMLTAGGPYAKEWIAKSAAKRRCRRVEYIIAKPQ